MLQPRRLPRSGAPSSGTPWRGWLPPPTMSRWSAHAASASFGAGLPWTPLRSSWQAELHSPCSLQALSNCAGSGCQERPEDGQGQDRGPVQSRHSGPVQEDNQDCPNDVKQVKVVLRVDSEEELLTLQKAAKEKDLPSHITIDAGRTQIAPSPADIVDEVTGSLKLMPRAESAEKGSVSVVSAIWKLMGALRAARGHPHAASLLRSGRSSIALQEADCPSRAADTSAAVQQARPAHAARLSSRRYRAVIGAPARRAPGPGGTRHAGAGGARPVSTFLHACEGEAVVKLTADKVPYFNAPIYLENKTQIGKVEEIFGPINESYFSVKMQEGVIASSYGVGDKFFIDPNKLLPLQRFLPQPKVEEEGEVEVEVEPGEDGEVSGVASGVVEEVASEAAERAGAFGAPRGEEAGASVVAARAVASGEDAGVLEGSGAEAEVDAPRHALIKALYASCRMAVAMYHSLAPVDVGFYHIFASLLHRFQHLPRRVLGQLHELWERRPATMDGGVVRTIMKTSAGKPGLLLNGRMLQVNKLVSFVISMSSA
eukprot:SM000126S26320  [mRNA]  locus=s126:97547:102696:- [translate_table: standard]